MGWSWGLTLTLSWSPTAVPWGGRGSGWAGWAGGSTRLSVQDLDALCGFQAWARGEGVREGHPPASQAPTLPAEPGMGGWRDPCWRAAVSLDPCVRGRLRPAQPGHLCLPGTRKFISNGTDGLKWNREN